MALAPDGTPRGPATAFGAFDSMQGIGGIVAPDGRRALLVYAGARKSQGGLHAIPLGCAE
jgi:hypothetical protein